MSQSFSKAIEHGSMAREARFRGGGTNLAVAQSDRMAVAAIEKNTWRPPGQQLYQAIAPTLRVLDNRVNGDARYQYGRSQLDGARFTAGAARVAELWLC